MLLKKIDTAFLQDAGRSIVHGIDILVRDGEIVVEDGEAATEIDAAIGTVQEFSTSVAELQGRST